MRKSVIVLGIIAVVVVVVLVAAWFLFDVNQYRGLIQAKLEQQLGRNVMFGTISLRLLPLRFQVADPVIEEDPRLQQRTPFIKAENLSVQVSLLSLFGRNVEINSVELRRPSVELIKDKEGKWNFSTLGARSSGAESAPQAESKGVALDRLTILDGLIGVTDLQQSRARSVYDHIDVSLTNYRPGQPFSFDLDAHIQGEGKQELRIKGNGGPIPESNPAGMPLHAMLSFNDVGVDGLKKFFETDVLARSSGVLTGESQLDSQNGSISATGKLKLEKARLNGVDIGYPIALDYNLVDNIDQSAITINTATLHLGPTPVSLAGSIDLKSSSPILNLKMNTGDVSIAEIARLASAFGVAFAPATTVAGRVATDVQIQGTAAKPVLNGSIKARDLKMSGQGVPQPVEIKAVDLALSPMDIQSNEFNATSGKTNVAARFAIHQYASNAPSIDAGVRAPTATLPEIQSIAKAYGMTGLDQFTGNGTLSLDMHAAGPLQTLDAKSITRALNGVVNVDFSPLRISGFDTVNELARIGGFANAVTSQNFTDILKFTGQIAVKNGIAQTENLRAQLGIGSLGVAGTADLATEALNMKLSAVFSKEYSDKVGASRVGGYLKTALSNDSGELVVPALLTGTMQQPKFAPDVQAFAQMQKQRLLPSLKDPAAALSGVLRSLKTKPETTTEGQPAQEKQEKQPASIKGVLDSILGGKK